jgi:DegV family protein with EDD domain
MTSSGSGAYQSCRAAIGMLKEQLPRLKVELLDTRQVAMSQGWVVIEAARAAFQGLPLGEVAARARQVASCSAMIQTADTLRYLYMGGRIGRAQHMVGSLLNIKPLIGMEDGVITALGTARTRAKAYTRIVELMLQRLPRNSPAGSRLRIKAAFTHCAALDRLEALKQQVTGAFECVETLVSPLSPALAVHSGPGTVGVSYFPVEYIT